jgi:hypothetical protein
MLRKCRKGSSKMQTWNIYAMSFLIYMVHMHSYNSLCICVHRLGFDYTSWYKARVTDLGCMKSKYPNCTKTCHFPMNCGLCSESVEKVLPKCKHEIFMPCHRDPSLGICDRPCTFHISCGHRCQEYCTQPCNCVSTLITMRTSPLTSWFTWSTCIVTIVCAYVSTD